MFFNKYYWNDTVTLSRLSPRPAKSCIQSLIGSLKHHLRSVMSSCRASFSLKDTWLVRDSWTVLSVSVSHLTFSSLLDKTRDIETRWRGSINLTVTLVERLRERFINSSFGTQETPPVYGLVQPFADASS